VQENHSGYGGDFAHEARFSPAGKLSFYPAESLSFFPPE
jgi:hypothetical protein